MKLIDANDDTGVHYTQPRGPWKNIEFWKHGKPITEEEAAKLAEAAGHKISELKYWPG